MQCAELHGHFPPRELAAKLIELGSSYNNALLVVERNNHGYGVLAHLRMDGVRQCVSRRGTGRVADFGGEPSGDDREPGCGAGDGAETVPKRGGC